MSSSGENDYGAGRWPGARKEGGRMNLRAASPLLLVVDDEPSNLESLERIFAREGLQVITAPDGREGLDLIRKRRIDVMLTDLMMPGVSGVDLLKATRQLSPE